MKKSTATIVATLTAACLKRMFSLSRCLATIATTALCTISSTAHADKVYFEMGLAEVTAGYDVETDETILRKWYLAAVGPGALKAELQQFVRVCAEESLRSAASAAYATPGEAGAKLSVAYSVWQTAFPRCMSTKALAKALVSKFKVGITENMYRVKGLVLRVKTYETTAGMYAKLYERLAVTAGGDVGKALKGFSAMESKIDAATRVDINIKAPEQFTSAIRRAKELSPEDAGKRVAELAAVIRQRDLQQKIPLIVPEVMRLSKTAVAQIDIALHPFNGDVNTVIAKLAPGPALGPLNPTLGKAVQDLAAAANDAAKRAGVNPTNPSVIPGCSGCPCQPKECFHL